MNYNPDKNPKAKELIAKLNEVKNNFVASDKPFAKEELRAAMKEIGFSCNGVFWSALTNCHCTEYGAKLVTMIGKAKWVFTKPTKPICWKDLQEIQNLYSKTAREYNSKFREKRKSEQTVESVSIKETPNRSIKIEDLIQYFRNSGAEVTITITVK